MIQAALFDLGGTLLEFNPRGLPWLEWERIGLLNVHRFLTARGHRLDLDRLTARFAGSLPERWEQAASGIKNLQLGSLLHESCAACGVALDEDEIEAAIAQYIAPVDQDVTIYADAVATVKALRERGLKIGLISNTMWPGRYHRQEMERFGLLPYFDYTVFSSDAGVWKPQPGIYELALDALGVAAQDAFFVGDIPQHDIAGAQAAGIRAVFRRNDSFALDGIRPDAEITALSELFELIERWS